MRFACLAFGIASLLLCGGNAATCLGAAASVASPDSSHVLPLEVDTKFAPRVLDHRGGEVRALAFLSNGRVLAGGSFDFAANSECRYLACFASDGTLDRSFASSGACDGPVTAIRVLPDGRVLVAGFFRTFAGKRAAGLVRLLADGGLDPAFRLPEHVDGGIAAIETTPDGHMYVGGSFTRFGDAQDVFLVRLTADGALDSSFRAQPGKKGKRTIVSSIAATRDGGAAVVLAVDDKRFEPLDAAVQPPAQLALEPDVVIARYLPDGRIDSRFRAQRTAALTPRCIIALPGGDFLVGGRGGVQRYGSDGLIDGSFRFAASGRMQVDALALLPDGRYLVGGAPMPGALLPARLLVVGKDGGIESRLVNPRGEEQFFLAVSADAEGHVIAAGQIVQTTVRMEFTTTTNRLLRLDSTLSSDGIFRAAVGSAGRITAIAGHPDGSLTIGGIFLSVAGESRAGLAHMRADGTLDRSFDPGTGLNAAPRVLVPTADGGVVAAGLLDRFDGQAAKAVVRICANGTVDWDFAPDIPFRGVFTDSAVLSDGTFILVGQLRGRTADATFSHVIRLDPAGKIDKQLASAVTSWLAPGAGSILTAAATATGHVLMGGEFSILQGLPRNAIARIGGEGQVDPAFVPDTAGFLSVTQATVLPDQRIFIEGWRRQAGEPLARRAFARLLPDGRRDPSFKSADFGEAKPLVSAALPDGTVVVAVRDDDPDAVSTRRLVRLDRDGSLMPGFDIDLGNSRELLHLLATNDGTVYVFGGVPSIGGQKRFGLARLVAKK